MAWPTTNIDETKFDADADSIADSRAELKQMADNINDMVDTPPGAGYTDSDVDTHLNTSTADANEILGWTGSDYGWISRYAFTSITADTGTTINADAFNDTLDVTGGTGITVDGDQSTDTLTISLSGSPTGDTFYNAGTLDQTASTFVINFTPDFSNGNIQKYLCTGDSSGGFQMQFPSNMSAGDQMRIIFLNDGTQASPIDFDLTFKPAFYNTNGNSGWSINEDDALIIDVLYDGTNYYIIELHRATGPLQEV